MENAMNILTLRSLWLPMNRNGDVVRPIVIHELVTVRGTGGEVEHQVVTVEPEVEETSDQPS